MIKKLLIVLGTLAVGAMAVLTFAQHSVVDLDLWGSMAMGRETLLRGWPPTQDPFAYVPTRDPVVYHEWLSGVVFYLLLQQFGSAALKLLMILLGILTLCFAALAGRRRGASYFSLLVTSVIALVSIQSGYGPIRAQAFTLFFFALFLLVLEEAEHGRGRLLLLIPPITIVWANLHGGFAAGVGLLALYILSDVLVGKRPWSLFGIGLVALLGTLVNPYGLGYWRYLQEALLMPRPNTPEWASLPFDLTFEWAFKVLLGLSALLLLTARERYWPGIIVMAVTAVLGIRHVRHIPFFALACLAYLPVHLSPLLDRVVASLAARIAARPAFPGVLASVMLGWLLLAAVFQFTRFTSWRLEVPADYFPVGAVEFVRLNGLQGNLATPYNWGEYVLWKLYPNVKVSFDGRFETVYSPQVSEDNTRFANGRGDWRRLLRDYPTNMVLVHKGFPIAHLMEKEPGWVLVYQDEISALYLPSTHGDGPWRFPRQADGTIP